MDIVEIVTGDQESNQEDSLTKDLIISKFKTYSKEKFQNFVKKGIDYLQYIKKSGQLRSFKFTDEKGELFIYYEDAPYYWLCDTTILLKIEESLRSDKSKVFSSESYKSIKEFYAKWVKLKSEDEKKYYALSTTKLIERDTHPDNILKYIFQAVIFTYDKNLYAPGKAIDFLNIAFSVLHQMKISEALKASVSYTIHIFQAFAYLKMESLTEVYQVLNEALKVNPTGITAKFYLALINKKIGDKESAIGLIIDIINYDKNMLKFGIEKNSLTFIYYIIQNAVTYSIFSENDFADMLEELDMIFTEQLGSIDLQYERLNDFVININGLFPHNLFSPDIIKSLEFIERVSHAFSGNKNKFVDLTKIFLQDKILKVNELILSSVKHKLNIEIVEKLKQFDTDVLESQKAIRILTSELDESVKEQNKKFEDTLQEFEKRTSTAIKAIEDKIENINKDKQFEPQTVFNNSMVYNIIVSLLVFIIGSFAGCYGGSIGGIYSFKEVMEVVIISGLQWAAVTFLLGIIICIFSVAFAYMEMVSEKQNLLKKITYMKANKEKENDNIKKEHEKILKLITENIKDRIELYTKACEQVKNEKEIEFTKLKADADAEIKDCSDKLLLTMQAAITPE
ncbi:MAG: hypothetical protein WCJ01_08040 [Ignavibacteria bacterium]